MDDRKTSDRKRSLQRVIQSVAVTVGRSALRADQPYGRWGRSWRRFTIEATGSVDVFDGRAVIAVWGLLGHQDVFSGHADNGRAARAGNTNCEVDVGRSGART